MCSALAGSSHLLMSDQTFSKSKMSEKSRKKTRVPRFRNRAEEAAFWDAHSPLEFEDEWEEMELKFARPLIHVFQFESDAETLDRLSNIARSRQMRLSDLMNEWLRERLEAEEAKPGKGPAPQKGRWKAATATEE